MCGIVGLISKEQYGFYGTHVDIFTEMLIMDQVRGMDGTGVFGIYKNKQAYLTKAGTHASNFIGLKDYGAFKERMVRSMNIVFGHNRKATVGNVSSLNSHPFMEDNIILIHNGFIQNASAFDAKAAVDSQALAIGLNAGKAEDVIPKIQGAYALVWYDKRDKTLRIARNAERPLFMVETPGFLAFASEPWMMLAALGGSRRNTAVKIDGCIEVEKHVIFEFTSGGDVKRKPYTPVNNYVSRYQGYCEDHDTPFRGGGRSVNHQHGFPHDRPLPITSPIIPRTTGGVTVLPTLRRTWESIMDSLPPVADTVAFRVRRLSHGHHGAEPVIQVEGGLCIDGHEIDFNGRIDWTTDLAEVNGAMGIDGQHQQWLEATIEAKGVTVSGPWVRVRDVFAPGMVQTHGKYPIPQSMWDRVVAHHSCEVCNSVILKPEAANTSVKLTTSGDITKVVCAKCVKQGLDKDDQNDQAGDSSVQAGQRIGQGTLH